MKRGIVRGAGILMWVLGGLIALLMAATFGPTLFGLESMIVGSGSMGRAMPVGSVALTREVDARSIAVGDIISFRHRGAAGTTTHRVVGVSAQQSQVIFTTKGDANGTPDPEKVVVDGRVHRVEYFVPFVGYAVHYARSPIGAIAFLIVPLLGLTLDRHRRKPGRPQIVAGEPGWSVTTLSLILAAPEALRSDPSG